jgi:predicted small integral membrane protein
MALRYIKIILVIFLALLCILYGVQNLANLTEAHWFMTTVLSMQDHVAYPHTFAFSIESPVLIWIFLMLVIMLELTAGALLAKGAVDLWSTRKEPAVEFNHAKHFTYIGAGVGLIVWFGLFTVIGGAFFQMWQTELGAASLTGSYQYLGSIALVTLFISLPDN